MKSVDQEGSQTHTVTILFCAQQSSSLDMARTPSETLLHQGSPEVNKNKLSVIEFCGNLSDGCGVLGGERLVSGDCCVAFLIDVFQLEMTLIDGRWGDEANGGIMSSY
jgi:hypothetical protein